MNNMLTFAKGSVIFYEGAYEPFMYMLESGSVGIYQNYNTPYVKKLDEIMDGFFGEMGVIQRNTRSATAVALTDVMLTKITKDDLQEMIKTKPIYLLWMTQQLSKRVRNMNDRYMTVCQEIAKAEGMVEETENNGKTMQEAGTFEAGEKTCKAGYVFMKEGADENWMYDLKQGSVGVYKGYGTPYEVKIAEIHGGLFGEMSVLESRGRSATVVALEDCVYEAVEAAQMEKYVEADPDRFMEIVYNLSFRLREIDGEYKEACAVLESLKKGAEKTGGLKDAILRFVYRFK